MTKETLSPAPTQTPTEALLDLFAAASGLEYSMLSYFTPSGKPLPYSHPIPTRLHQLRERILVAVRLGVLSEAGLAQVRAIIVDADFVATELLKLLLALPFPAEHVDVSAGPNRWQQALGAFRRSPHAGLVPTKAQVSMG